MIADTPWRATTCDDRRSRSVHGRPRISADSVPKNGDRHTDRHTARSAFGVRHADGDAAPETDADAVRTPGWLDQPHAWIGGPIPGGRPCPSAIRERCDRPRTARSLAC